MLGANASIVIDNDLTWWFRWYWTAHKIYTLLVPPNSGQNLRTINIRLCRRCWSMVELTPRSSTFKVIVVYPLFVAGHDTKKTFHFGRRRSCSHLTRSRSTCLGFNSYGTQCPCFKSFVMLSNVYKVLCDQLLIILQFRPAPDTSLHKIILHFIVLNFFCALECLYIQHENNCFWRI